MTIIEKGKNKMISNMLLKENVQILDRVTDWQEVIYLSTINLIEQGYITENYPKKIIELTEKHGAYYVLCPDVALLHARPEDGVIQKQLAVTLVKEPVAFKGKKDKVRLVITMAAEDSQSHLAVLQQLAEIISNEKRLKSLTGKNDPESLYKEFVS
jgi:ascorbate PTS system EIIA or EIIAB component